jgi:hypothetical protein
MRVAYCALHKRVWVRYRFIRMTQTGHRVLCRCANRDGRGSFSIRRNASSIDRSNRARNRVRSLPCAPARMVGAFAAHWRRDRDSMPVCRGVHRRHTRLNAPRRRVANVESAGPESVRPKVFQPSWPLAYDANASHPKTRGKWQCKKRE